MTITEAPTKILQTTNQMRMLLNRFWYHVYVERGISQ
jgi:hypothetical protein